ncbi:MAG: N-acyl-L-amino acid amidohydrolase [Gemmatimonadetes bacterium SCN 70-22]|nr:MAG: N-acyl-L-amino acid amidohydrolase [Gemmatimonadetes bacterium SCN 70-22]
MRIHRRTALVPALTLLPALAAAQAPTRTDAEVDRRARDMEARVVAWRRDIHQHPELGNREFRTSKLVAEHLQKLGLEVKTGVAHTGVVGILRGGKPGPVVALRADMDALPVAEEVDLPFKSTVRATYNGQEVGVMHACGHDNHVAILMGVAEILAGMRSQLQGTVKFVFQPAEEGAPAGEEGGAGLMLEEGAFDNPRVDAVFGLHVFPFEVGKVVYRAGGLMASGDTYRVVIRGRQTHGALPWNGIDPITISSQVISNLQSIVSRTVDLTLTPAIVTVGYIRGGVRVNIIPDSVEFGGTIRAFDEATRDSILARFRRIVTATATANGATAEIRMERGTPVTWNDPALTEQMVPSLRRALGASQVEMGRQTTTSEDFSLFQKAAPGLFVFLGITPKGADPATVAPNHSPRFYADEGALVPGMKTLSTLAIDYLAMHAGKPKM